MPLEPQEVRGKSSEEGLGSLRGCLVEGDAEQRIRERRVRRRALTISIVLQSAVLAALILVPLFSKTPRIALAYATPVPPYSPYRSASHNSGAPHAPNGPKNVCHICAPINIPSTIATHDLPSTSDGADQTPPEGLGPGIPGAPNGLIPVFDPTQKVRPPERTDREVTQPRRLRFTQLDPAMLIHRVEPIYPPLARQTHREGRVELRAIIGTDGRIRSLQIVAGDPLFEQSAVEAVQQWRYKPTILNGQPVEIDTSIMVIYSMQR